MGASPQERFAVLTGRRRTATNYSIQTIARRRTPPPRQRILAVWRASDTLKCAVRYPRYALTPNCGHERVLSALAMSWLITPLSATCAVLGAFAYAQAEPSAPRTERVCATGHIGADCLAAFEIDLDGDGKPDDVSMVHDALRGMYWIAIYTASGRNFTPFQSYYDPKVDRVTLTVREGEGDFRCRSWVNGQSCGHVIGSHDLPGRALYLSDSKRGDFLL